jgi:hypothetical protein
MTEHYYGQEYFSLEHKKEVKKQIYRDQYNLLITKLETLLNEEYELSHMQGVKDLVPVISERIEVEMMLYKLYDSINSDFHDDNRYIQKFIKAPKMILQLRIQIADKYAAKENRKQEELIHHYHDTNMSKDTNTNTTVDYMSWLNYIPNPINLFSQ